MQSYNKKQTFTFAFKQNNYERLVDALALKKVNHSLTDNLKSRDASASKKSFSYLFCTQAFINQGSKVRSVPSDSLQNCGPFLMMLKIL